MSEKYFLMFQKFQNFSFPNVFTKFDVDGDIDGDVNRDGGR